MEKMLFLSVIIPVYNVEKYLSQCLDSVLSQSFSNFEVILVDDGSQDNSGKICEEYAEKDCRINVYHNSNGGVSAARNFGLSKAKGNYIVFLDSDDFYSDSTFFEKLYQKVDNVPDVEVVSFPVQYYFGENDFQTKWSYDVSVLEKIDDVSLLLSELIARDCLIIYPWDKAIKRSFLMENNLMFKIGMKNEEDAEWCLRMFPRVKKFAFMETPTHLYRQNREGSATSKTSNIHLENMFSVLEEYSQKFLKSDLVEENVLLHYMAYRYTIMCGALMMLPKNDFKKDMRKKLKSYRWLLKYRLSGKVKKAYRVYRLLGFSGMSMVLGLYIRLH